MAEENGFYEEAEILGHIQQTLRAPKSQYNSFGGYHYRNLEDIDEAIKPLLAETGTTLTFSDRLVYIGDRYYVESTAHLKRGDKVIGESVAYAREQETKKGMDTSQITGAASSYARKYAASGLFLIDDNKDADSRKPESEKPEPKPPEPAPQKPLEVFPETETSVPDEGMLLANLFNVLGIKGEDEELTLLYQQFIEQTANNSGTTRYDVLKRANQNHSGFWTAFNEWKQKTRGFRAEEKE